MVVGFTTTNVPVESVPITTKVVSSNPVHGDCLLDITLCDKVCQWLATGRWFSPGTSVSWKICLYQHDIFIFRRGGKPCIANIHGDLPLHHALRCKHEEVVDVFLDFFRSSYKVMSYLCHIKSCLPLHHSFSSNGGLWLSPQKLWVRTLFTATVYSI
jgi:hypothetical protein